MGHPYAGTNITKAQYAADATNQCIDGILLKCKEESTADGPRIEERCHISIVGYGGQSYPVHQATAARPTVPTSRREAGLIIDGWPETFVRHPRGGRITQWVEPKYHGGTPMSDAFDLAEELIQYWFHHDELVGEDEKWRFDPMTCIQPIVINITDGIAEDFERELNKAAALRELPAFEKELELQEVKTYVAAQRLKSHFSNFGNVLLFNIQLSDSKTEPSMFPTAAKAEEFDPFEKLLFTLSSELPKWMVDRAKLFSGLKNLQEGCRGMVLNLDPPELHKLLVFSSYVG
ncbi:MAG TPA: hypothetical protein VN653_17010 [Anaerolineales bacterium]|nr:hypothetical protein [Anaerolineales bacterium]